jgi:hypothetical protein
MNADILRYIMSAIGRKRPENWRINSWFVIHDNAPAHRPITFQDFLAKYYVTTLEHPPYSPGLASADFELLSRLKSALKGRRICDGAKIIKNATKELKRLSQNDLQECFNENTHSCQSLAEVFIFIESLF